MTLRFVDGMDYFPLSGYGALASASGWTNLSDFYFSPNADTAFGYGKSLKWNNNNSTRTIYRWLKGRYEGTLTYGVRVFVPDGGGASTGYTMYMSDTGSTRNIQWGVEFDGYGRLTFTNYTSGSSSLVSRSASYSYYPGQWFYLEMQWTPDAGTSGTWEARINTEVVLSLSGIRTADGVPVLPYTTPGIDYMILGFTGAADAGFSIDDMYMVDDSGSLNNDYLGNVRVKSLPVVSNASPIDFSIGGTSPAATNWQSVLNSLLTDAQYVFSPTVGDRDLYGVDPQVSSPFVYGIQIDGSYRQDDATQMYARNTIQSNGVDAYGATKALNQTYSVQSDIFELNPDTGVQFTAAEVNALKIGPQVDS